MPQHFLFLLLISFPPINQSCIHNPISLLQILKALAFLSQHANLYCQFCNTYILTRAFQQAKPQCFMNFNGYPNYLICYFVFSHIFVCLVAFFIHFVVKFIFTQLTNSDYFKRDLQPFCAIIHGRFHHFHFPLHRINCFLLILQHLLLFLDHLCKDCG